MAIQIGEAVVIHEAVIRGFVVGGATGGEGAADDVIDLLARLEMQGEEGFADLAGVGDVARGEAPETLVAEEHGVEVRADDHAGCVFIGEVGIEAETEGGEKGDGGLEVLDGEVHEHLGGGGGRDGGRGGFGGGAHGGCSRVGSMM